MEYQITNGDTVTYNDKTYKAFSGRLILLIVNKTPNIDTVVKSVTDAYQHSISELRAKSRTSTITEARKALCYYLYTDTHLSTNEIGRLIKRTHPTVLHHIKSYAFLKEKCKPVTQMATLIENNINNTAL